MTIEQHSKILMEGALGERLKREYHITFDEMVAMASLVYNIKGREALYSLWSEYIEIAKEHNLPFMATTPTRRANKHRVASSKYDADIIKDNVEFLKSVRESFPETEIYIGGLMGCKGDAYKADEVLNRQAAKEFHSWQAGLFKDAGVDFLYAGIMPALEEAIGMAEAMAATNIPYIISFMIRNNGCLIDGTKLSDAIAVIDELVARKPMCYMANCVHPRIVRETLSYDFNRNDYIKNRFRGVQVNSAYMPPEILDGCESVVGTGPKELAEEIKELTKVMDITICGGCCGTTNEHIREIASVIR